MVKFENSTSGAKLAAEHIIGKLEDEGLKKYENRGGISLIFVAGAPGAGKTEFIESVLDCASFVVIDIDEYRKNFEGYNGKNAREYQDCSSRVATRIYDYCIKNDLKVIFDGTLTSNMGIKNIQKGNKKKRKMGIVLIYQDPMISYAFTKARQIQNIRNVDIDTFMKIYYNSILYCFDVVKKYKSIQIVVASKNKNRDWKQNIFTDKSKFDKYYGVEYNPDVLKDNLIHLEQNDDLLSNFRKLWKK